MSTATMSPEVAAQHELHITRVFDAPRELVWKVWTDPEHMKHWAGPRQFGFDVGDGELKKFDLRQGGENLEVVEPERLVYTFKWEDNPGLSANVETVITVTFEEHDGKTTMTFHQAFFVTEKDRDGHVRGWNSSFDKLADYLGEVQMKEGFDGKQ